MLISRPLVSTPMSSSILIVDDEPGVRSALGGVLRDEGYTVDAVDSGEACLDRLSRQPYDVVVLDIWLPRMDGLATLARMRERECDAEVVIISGHGSVEAAVRAIKMGAFDFVEKPLSLDKTVLVVRNALRQRRLQAENLALRAKVDAQHTMVGESLAMARLRDQIAMAAPVERPRADLRRERHRQGAGGAQHPRDEPAPRARRSSRSTAPPFPRS